MKKLYVTLAIVVLAIGVFGLTNFIGPEPLKSKSDTNVTPAVNFNWHSVQIKGSGGDGPNQFPKDTLTLTANNETFVINDYYEGGLYGCDANAKEIAKNQIPPDAISYELCYVMAAGNFFYITEEEDGYAVKHKVFGDIDPDTEPVTTLFTISRKEI